MTGPQPGWYPDPEDPSQARYWDGEAWTEHAHPVGPTPAAPGESEPPGPSDPARDLAPSRGPDAVGTPPPGEHAADRWSTVEGGSPPSPPPPGPGTARPPGGRSPFPAIVVTVIASIVLVGVLAVFAVSGSIISGLSDEPDSAPSAEPEPGTPAQPRTVDPAALDAAGCVDVDPGDGADRSHFELDDAPPAEEIYDVPLPAWGPHTPQVLPPLGLVDQALDVRVLLHNLEHGAIVVWLDAATHADPEVRDEVTGWLEGLRAGGFRSDAGSNLYASPTPDDAEVAPVSLRAWGVAMDCPGWDEAAADAFVARHYGSRGEAPESSLGPYPEDGPLRAP